MSERPHEPQPPTKQTLNALHTTLKNIPKSSGADMQRVAMQFPYDSPEGFLLDYNLSDNQTFHLTGDGQLLLAWVGHGFRNIIPRAKVIIGVRVSLEGTDFFKKDTYELYKKKVEHHESYQEIVNGKINVSEEQIRAVDEFDIEREERKAGFSQMSDQEAHDFNLKLQELTK